MMKFSFEMLGIVDNQDSLSPLPRLRVLLSPTKLSFQLSLLEPAYTLQGVSALSLCAMKVQIFEIVLKNLAPSRHMKCKRTVLNVSNFSLLLIGRISTNEDRDKYGIPVNTPWWMPTNLDDDNSWYDRMLPQLKERLLPTL